MNQLSLYSNPKFIANPSLPPKKKKMSKKNKIQILHNRLLSENGLLSNDEEETCMSPFSKGVATEEEM